MGDRCAVAFLTLFVAASSAAAQDRFRTYGIVDVEAEWSDESSATKNGTFDIHHFNVVSTFRLDDEWRVFSEVEWEHGPAIEGSGGSGLIALERAWVEFRASRALQIRAGKFLPPFGIYNERHDATPTFLMTFLPAAIYGKHGNTTGGSQRLYAKFGTGVQVLGSVAFGTWTGSYHVYVSNGRGVNPGGTDDNRNKGLGARVILGSAFEGLTLGASFYADRNGLAADTRQEAYAADVTARVSGFTLEVEGMIPRLETLDPMGVPSGSFRGGLAYYAQGSYRIGERLTPFGRFERYDPDRSAPDDHERSIVMGVNLAATGAVFLKSEVHLRSFGDPTRASNRLFLSSIAVAF